MKKHLTDAAIQRFRAPKEGQAEIFDLGYPGLALRIGKGGAKSFVLFHRKNGKLTRTTLGRWPKVSLADARTAWRNVAEGKAPTSEKELTGDLFSVVVENWLKLDAAQRNRPSSLRLLHNTLDHDVLPVWRDRHINDIGRRDITSLIDGLIARGVPVKARAVHAYLHRMFKWSVGRGIIDRNPMEGMERPAKQSSREQVLNDDELAKIYKACSRQGMPGAVVQMLILTGARREEIAQLKWSEIQGDTIRLSNGRTKNGEGHIIPLSAPAKALLASLPRIEGDFVFTYDGLKGVSGWSWNKRNLDAACGVSGWVIHDIRRSVSTGMNEKLGIDPHIVEAVLGHTLKGVAAVYNKAKHEAAKRAALEAWAALVMRLVS